MTTGHRHTKRISFLYLPLAVFCYIIFIHIPSGIHAQSDVYLAVRAGGTGLISIGLGGFESSGGQDVIGDVRRTLEDDLSISGLFRVVAPPDTAAGGSILERWKTAGARYYLLGEAKKNGGSVAVDLIDLRTALTVMRREYLVDRARPWYTSHVMVDDMIEHFTGVRGGLAAQIVFVRTVNGSDELFLVGADGRDIRQITYSKTLIKSPEWSPDGSKVIYSALHGDSWLIMVTDIRTGRSTDITIWPGLNTTPEWSPVEPEVIAFTSARDGNAEIYTCRTDGKGIRRLTNHRRIDSSPAWSPDGSKIAFVSDRTGNPLIYIMNRDGSNQHRLTATPNAYEGSPAWSPLGDRIAFVMMSDYGFDIATASPSGEDVVVLTFGQGSNEDPHWSPDGLRIVFTSTRTTGIKRLYIMNRDGSNVRPLIKHGNGFSPAWAPAVTGDDIRVSSKR